MKDTRAEKLLIIRFIKFLNDFQTTEVTERRIRDYDYQENTTVVFNDTAINQYSDMHRAFVQWFMAIFGRYFKIRF